MSTARHRKKATQLPAKHVLPETKAQPLPTPMTFNQRARSACLNLWTIITSPIRRCLTRTPRAIAEVGIDQMVLEGTYVGTTANVIRILPLATKPWPMIASQVAWAAWKYCALGVTYRLLPNSRYRTMLLTSISLTGNAFRFIDDQYSAFIGLMGLLIVHSRLVNNSVFDRCLSKTSQNEIRAALYLLIWEGPALYNFAKHLFPKNKFEVFSQNRPAVKKYKKILGLKEYNPYLDDERFFHIYKNVKYLGQEKVRIFLDQHHNETLHNWQSLSMAAQSQPGDWIILESVQAQQIVDCNSYSAISVMVNGKETIIRPEFPVTSSCIGGDDINIVDKTQNRIKARAKIKKAISTMKIVDESFMQDDTPTTRSAAARLQKAHCKATLTQSCDFIDDPIQTFIDSTCELEADTIEYRLSTDAQNSWKRDIEKLFSSMTFYNGEAISKRNRALLETILKLSATEAGKIDVVIGLGHFISDKDFDIDNPFAISPSAEQYEIRNALDKSKIPYSMRLQRP